MCDCVHVAGGVVVLIETVSYYAALAVGLEVTDSLLPRTECWD